MEYDLLVGEEEGVMVEVFDGGAAEVLLRECGFGEFGGGDGFVAFARGEAVRGQPVVYVYDDRWEWFPEGDDQATGAVGRRVADLRRLLVVPYQPGDRVVGDNDRGGVVERCVPPPAGSRGVGYDTLVRWDDGDASWVDAGQLD